MSVTRHTTEHSPAHGSVSYHDREDEAAQCLPHTELTPGMAWALVCFFLLLIIAEPVAQLALDLHKNIGARKVAAQHGAPLPRLTPQMFDVFTLLPTVEEWQHARGVGGYWQLLPGTDRITAYEEALKSNSFTTSAVLPHVQLALAGWLGAGNERAYCGQPGWLFYRPDVDYATSAGFLEPHRLQLRARAGSTAMQPNPVTAIAQFHAQLASRGITLVLMPMPSKAIIHPEALNPAYAGTDVVPQNPSYDAFLQALSREGVRVVDVTTMLRMQAQHSRTAQYLRTDTHWTPAAMEAAAGELADYLTTNKLLVPRAPAGFTRQEARLASDGDLVTMLKLPPKQRLFPRQTVTIHPVATVDGRPWRPQRDADVLVLGDSYFNIFSLAGMNWGAHAGFAEQLSYRLHRPLDTIVVNAGGSFATRQQLYRELLRGRDRLAGKRVVVYEFAMRDLYEGDWKLFDLPKPKPAPSKPITPLVVPAFTLSAPTPVAINPAKGERAAITVRANVAASYTLTVRKADGTIIAELGSGRLTAGTPVLASWNGRDTAGKLVAAGTYTVVVEGTVSDGKAIPAVKNTVIVAAAEAQALAAAVVPATIDPTAGQTATVTVTVPAAGNYRITVRNAAGMTVATPVKQQTVRNAGTSSSAWHGKDRAGTPVADGVYTVNIEGAAADGTLFTPASATVTVKTRVVAPPTVAQGLVIQGKVKSVTKAPVPGSVPYKDCVIALEISVSKTVSGTLGSGDILVYLWGMRDNRLYNATLAAGQAVTLKLTPWETAEGEYGGYNRIEPTSEDVLMLDAYWGEVK